MEREGWRREPRTLSVSLPPTDTDSPMSLETLIPSPWSLLIQVYTLLSSSSKREIVLFIIETSFTIDCSTDSLFAEGLMHARIMFVKYYNNNYTTGIGVGFAVGAMTTAIVFAIVFIAICFVFKLRKRK